MKIIRNIVFDVKTTKVRVVASNTNGLWPLAMIGSKLTNPPFNEMGVFISIENLRNLDPQKVHDNIPQLCCSSESTGHNSRLGVSAPTIFDTAYSCE